MAAGSFVIYNASKAWLLDGTFDWITDNHYLHLLTNTHVPALTDSTWTDIDNEVTDGDYGAVLMATEAINGGTATATGNIDAANVSFGTNVTITARIAVVRVGTATPGGTDKLVGYVYLDTAADVSSTNGTFEVQWNANGLSTFA
jgi:hypothetical protein